MTIVLIGKPDDRARRIELVGAIYFGRDPSDPNKALPGWQAKLSTAMGMGRTAVNDTLAVASSDKFNRRLAGFIAGTTFQIVEYLHTLEVLEQIFGHADRERAAFDPTFTPGEGDIDE